MKTSLFATGTHTFREARMLQDALRGAPENVPPQERPQGDTHIDLRADQATPEMLRTIDEQISQLRQGAEGTVEEQMQRLEATAQRNIDNYLAGGPRGHDEAVKYIHELNDALHQMKPQAYHGGAIDMHIQIKPYNPTQFPPEVIARKNRVNELQGMLNQVDRNIQELKNSFRQNAAEYRGQKGAAMNRFNIAPEINQFMMQFPGASMQAHGAPLNQLYAMKFKLQQELAGVKSGMIKVPVPGQGGPEGTQDPSLINDPRFAGGGRGDARFNLDGAPGGFDGTGPIEMTPQLEARIGKLCVRWKGCKTQEERDTVEGFMLMDGVDVDNSNLAKEEITMGPREEKAILFIVGLIKVLKSLIDRFGNKKTAVDSVVGKDLTDPSEMTEEDRAKEKGENDIKLKDLKTREGKTETDIKEAEKKLKDTAKPLEGEAKEKLEKDLKILKQELETIKADIAKLTERNKLLDGAKGGPDKKGKLLKGDELKDDSVFKDFQRAKQEAKGKMRAAMEQLLSSGDVAKNMQRLGKALGVDFNDVDWEKSSKKTAQDLIRWLDTFIDHADLEKNGTGKYRISMDVMQAIRQSQDIDIFKGVDLKPGDLTKLAERMKPGIAGISVSGDKLVTDFVSGEDFVRGL